MPLLPGADPLLAAAIVILAGVTFGAIAKLINLPSITGQVLIGIGIGAHGLHLFDGDLVDGLRPITNFALGLMAVGIGAHLNWKRLRNAGRRLFLLLLFEATVTPAIVFAATVWLPGITWSTALLLGALAVSTAPATILAIVKEARAHGVFVKTLMGAVAFNNIACIFLFEVARQAAHVELDPSRDLGLANLILPAVQLLKAVALGGIAAIFMHVAQRIVGRQDLITTAAVLTILLTTGVSSYLGVSPLLSCLFLGVIQTNTHPDREKVVDTMFSNFEPAIMAVFFTLAGMHLSFEHIGQAGFVAAALFAARLAGKYLSVRWAMKLAGATRKVREHLGLALIPQAGVAIGLVFLIRDDPIFAPHAELIDLFIAVVLTVVTTNEIVGPIFTRRALVKAGEVDMDRSRLLDFIQEQNIITGLEASTKHEAIERLVDLMISSHHLEEGRHTLLRSVLDREAQASTCFGGGLAVPHGILPIGQKMVGVMGLSQEGLTLETPDGRPVHCMVLLGTSEGERGRHLQVLAALARTVGRDPRFQEQLFNSKTPAHAYEILHGDEAEDFNYFLDDG